MRSAAACSSLVGRGVKLIAAVKARGRYASFDRPLRLARERLVTAASTISGTHDR